MMSLWDALRMNMMISYQELVRTFPKLCRLTLYSEIVMDNLALWYRRFGEPESVLQPEAGPPGELMPGNLRVRMLFSPINASDLIPITGAYRHRTPLPAVAGYEGVGIVTQAPASFAHLSGCRVLPLRGQEPGSMLSIVRQSMLSRFRNTSIRIWPHGRTSIRWRHR
jgi:hypothetical protein